MSLNNFLIYNKFKLIFISKRMEEENKRDKIPDKYSCFICYELLFNPHIT